MYYGKITTPWKFMKNNNHIFMLETYVIEIIPFLLLFDKFDFQFGNGWQKDYGSIKLK